MISLKKLNNKGLTAVEILVCFVLMVILTVSMYSTVISYKNKQNIESDREKIIAYKNLLTKEIQDDLIKKGLIDAKLIENISSDGNNTDKYYKVEFTFRDGTKKILEVTAQYAKDFEVCSGSLSTEEEAACKYDKDDVLKVSYGTAPGADDYTSYVLPDLGYGYNGNIYASEYGNQCSGNYDEIGVELDDADKQGCKVYDFRISNVIVETEDIFNFYVGFYHPDFETRYGIDIVYPITLSVEQSALELGPLCGTQTPERVDWDNTGELTVTVECVAREGGMPCAQPSFSKTFTGDAKSNYITISTTDGNETKCPVITNIDSTKPNKPTIVSTEGFPEGTWKNSNFTLMVTSFDRHSGIAYYQYCYPGADNTCGEGEWTTYNGSKRTNVESGEFTYETTAFSAERSEDVWIRAIDSAGNKSDPGKFRINLDKTGPTISNVNFDKSTRTLTATITDNLSKVSEYSLTPTENEPVSYNNIEDVATYNVSKNIDDDFSGLYYIWAKDSVGNKANKVSINIPPSRIDVVNSYQCSNASAGSEPKEMTYTGKCEIIDDGNDNWRVKFLTSGNLTFVSDVEIDVFLVGGGSAGKSTDSSSGKNGGSGGYTFTKKNLTLNANQKYLVVIGLGGQSSEASGQASTAFGFRANGGTLMAGGSGGGAGGLYGGTYRCNNGGSGANDGYSAGTVDSVAGGSGQRAVPGPNGERGSTREFGESSGVLYAGGGGGGGANKSDPYNYCSGDNGLGGSGGGGTPSKSNQSEADGKPNTGGGGAGAKSGYKTGKGGSGVVVIRNKR